MSADATVQQLFQSAQFVQQGNLGQAIEMLRPLADAKDARASALLSFVLLQQGNIDEALPYGEPVTREGYGQLAQLFAQDLAQRGRVELRSRAPEFAARALDQGYAVDLMSMVINSAAQGEPSIVTELLDTGAQHRPSFPAHEWQDFLAGAKGDGERITAAAIEAENARDEAKQAIENDVSALSERRTVVERQADEIGLVTSAIAAENLADAYAKDAERTEAQSRNYTAGSLIIGAMSVAASAYGLISVKTGSSVDTVIARAAFGVPVALLAAYVNNLATTHRRESWRLRHIELQIRTANPFLGLLDSERRRETLAALALRFFPGQEGINEAKESGGLPVDVIEAIGKLLKEQHVTGATVPSSPQTTG